MIPRSRRRCYDCQMTIFGNATQRVRPLRPAFLVEPNNKAHLREAIQIASSIWGGAYCPIVPMYKQMPATWREHHLNAPKAQTVISGYLDAFDPDLLVQFQTDVPDFIKEYGIDLIKPGEIWGSLGERGSIAPKYAVGVFEILNDVFEKGFKYKAKYPPSVVIPTLPKEHQLFWASVLGELPPAVMPLLKRHYYEPLEITELNFQPDEFSNITKERVLFPRRLSLYGLNTAKRSWRRGAYAFFLDATKVEDIVDYWNLRALGGSVLPIPKQMTKSEAWLALTRQYFRDHRVPWPHNNKVCDHASLVRSRNSTMEEMEAFAKTLELRRTDDDPSDSPFLSFQHWYPRMWDEWAREKDGAVPGDVYGDEERIEIPESESPKFLLRPKFPAFAEYHAHHGTWRCANDISFHIYGSTEPLAEVFPRSSGKQFLSAIGGRYRTHDDWRIGRGGLVRLVRDDFPATWETPSAQDVFFAWLEDLGWKPELSPPGRLAKQIYRQLEGHPNFLKDEKLVGVLEHMNGGTVQANGQPVDVNRVSQSRELPIGEIRSRLQDPERRTRNVVDYLIRKGVFRVGLRVQCPHCTRHSWYSVGVLGEVFTCPRCLNEFRAIGSVESGKWSYKTSGPFSVPRYADGAFATLLALEFFTGRHSLTFQATPTFSFTAKAADKSDLEADFAFFWRQTAYGELLDGIAFGECKTYGLFAEQDYKRMRFLAKTFPGAVLVFATLRKELTAKEVRAISRIAKAGRTYWKPERPINPVLILTGRELLDPVGPPYCWRDNDVDKRFENTRELLDICNATQQLYLGLRPWEQDWSERWEKQRRRKEQPGADVPSTGVD